MPSLLSESSYTSSREAVLSDRDFDRLSEFIHTECGIKMPPSKKIMLQARLQKRLRKLSMTSMSEYCSYLFSPAGIENELIHMIDVVTTNKTDFFREPKHFDYMVQKALPELMAGKGVGIRHKLTVWSAGCSTGEEPYTLAMLLKDFADQYPGFNFDFLILATDISTRALEIAKRAIYDNEKVAPVPPEMKKRYLLRGKNDKKGYVRIVPELRDVVRFRRLNFLEGTYGMSEPMDIIFCRNVIIYFDRATQEKLMNRFARQLSPGGYIFIGHSETLHGLNVPLVQVAPTVYRNPV
ncbi:MAG: chemotaxis protein CheR [Nitrospira bacterium SG8_35_4]|nr:MAG: chemotaxis protein CheR [Nitrospira bacterium SG8_35_4]